jgi:hypothetical protein
MTAYEGGVLLGMLTVGLLLGLITLRYGRRHGQDALGWGGLAACIAASFALGILAAGPMTVLFHWLIRRRAAKAAIPAVPAWPDMRPERLPQ